MPDHEQRSRPAEAAAGSRDGTLPGLPTTASLPGGILGEALCSSTAHLAYLTNDTRGAVGHFEALGVGPWDSYDMPRHHADGSTGPINRVSFAFMAGRMFELIEPLAANAPVFPLVTSPTPAISFHHVGAFVPVDPQVVVGAAERDGLDAHRSKGPRGDIVFVDLRPTLGHWLEVLCFAQGSRG